MLSDLESPSNRAQLAGALLVFCLVCTGPVCSAVYSLFVGPMLLGFFIVVCGDSVYKFVSRRAKEARDREDAIDAKIAAEDRHKAETRKRRIEVFENKTLCIHEHCDSCHTGSVSGFEWSSRISDYTFFSDVCDSLAMRMRAPCKKCLVCGSKTDSERIVHTGRLEPPDPSAWLVEAHAHRGRTRYYEAVVDY